VKKRKKKKLRGKKEELVRKEGKKGKNERKMKDVCWGRGEWL